MAGGFQHRAKNRHRRGTCGGLLVIVALAGVFGGLCYWTGETEEAAHYVPPYERVDIRLLLDKKELTDADYALLFLQTGLARPGVEQLREECSRMEYHPGRHSGERDPGAGNQGTEDQGTGNQGEEDFQDSLLALQDRFFAEPEITCERDMFLVWSEWLVPGQEPAPSALLASRTEGWPVGHMTSGRCFPALQDGDILVSFSSHIFGWRSGHAGIVVDAAGGQTLEAIAVGHDSRICSLDSWAEYPSVAVLRLKGASREERAQVAAFAREYLVGIPYRVASFTWTVPEMPLPAEPAALEPSLLKEPAALEPFLPEAPAAPVRPLPLRIPAGTQCAHLVWAAYAHFGYDLDGDGGSVVTPADLFWSSQLEVVQVYGLDPARLKK